MLVLTRKLGERICIGEDIVVTVVRIQNDKVRIAIEAPASVGIYREEILLRSAQANLPTRTHQKAEDADLQGSPKRMATSD